MPAYLIVDNEITDPKAYDEYRRQVLPLLDRFGGRLLARGGPILHLEGNWKPKRLVIIEFRAWLRYRRGTDPPNTPRCGRSVSPRLPGVLW